MIEASEEEFARNNDRQNVDGEFLQYEDEDDQDDDAQLRFDLSALNLEPDIPFSTEKKKSTAEIPASRYKSTSSDGPYRREINPKIQS